jgi:hypothetical protein
MADVVVHSQDTASIRAIIVMSDACKAHHPYPGYTGTIFVGYHGQFCVITIQ